jgi:hypothetical protein
MGGIDFSKKVEPKLRVGGVISTGAKKGERSG